MKQEQIKKPNLTDVLLRVKDDILNSINKIEIGTIQSFNEDNQTASIKVSLKKVISVDVNGNKTVRDYTTLVDCPCLILGGGESRIEFPITKGDFGILLFNDRDIDNWFTIGDGATPNTGRIHNISDGFCIVGLRCLVNAITDYATDSTRWRYDANNYIKIKSGEVDIVSALIAITGALTVSSTIKATGQVQGGSLKADNGASGTVYVASAPAGSPTTAITFSNGVRTA